MSSLFLHFSPPLLPTESDQKFFWERKSFTGSVRFVEIARHIATWIYKKTNTKLRQTALNYLLEERGRQWRRWESKTSRLDDPEERIWNGSKKDDSNNELNYFAFSACYHSREQSDCCEHDMIAQEMIFFKLNTLSAGLCECVSHERTLALHLWLTLCQQRSVAGQWRRDSNPAWANMKATPEPMQMSVKEALCGRESPKMHYSDRPRKVLPKLATLKQKWPPLFPLSLFPPFVSHNLYRFRKLNV